MHLEGLELVSRTKHCEEVIRNDAQRFLWFSFEAVKLQGEPGPCRSRYVFCHPSLLL